MKGKFFIKASKDSVITEKGVRAFVMERLLNSPLQKGAVFNTDEKIVEVQLEGEKEKIEEFIKALKKAVVGKFENPLIEFTGFEEDLKLEAPKIMRSSSALMVGQLQKGIDVQLKILNALDGMSEKLSELPGQIAEKLRH